MSILADLNARFGLAEQLQFEMLNDSTIVANLRSPLCDARIAMQGAQVLDWAPMGQRSVIWLSPDAKFAPSKSVRGGVPVCWPWFGAHASQSDYPAHGYARTVPWEVLSSELLSDGRIKLAFRLQASDKTRALWPSDSPLELHITLGYSLELELITRNNTKAPLTIGEALHTYFAVGDVRQVHVLGLDGCEYLDKVANFTRVRQQGKIGFSGEVDRVYLNTESECVIEDKSWGRNIHIKKRGSQSTVVWNPWVEKAQAMGDLGPEGYLKMLCVESGNAADNLVSIKAGDEHRLWVEYRVEGQR